MFEFIKDVFRLTKCNLIYIAIVVLGSQLTNDIDTYCKIHCGIFAIFWIAQTYLSKIYKKYFLTLVEKVGGPEKQPRLRLFKGGKEKKKEKCE